MLKIRSSLLLLTLAALPALAGYSDCEIAAARKKLRAFEIAARSEDRKTEQQVYDTYLHERAIALQKLQDEYGMQAYNQGLSTLNSLMPAENGKPQRLWTDLSPMEVRVAHATLLFLYTDYRTDYQFERIAQSDVNLSRERINGLMMEIQHDSVKNKLAVEREWQTRHEASLKEAQRNLYESELAVRRYSNAAPEIKVYLEQFSLDWNIFDPQTGQRVTPEQIQATRNKLRSMIQSLGFH